MTVCASFQRDFDEEMTATRRLLERAGALDMSWRPHRRLRSLGELAMHLAMLPRRVRLVLGETCELSDLNGADAGASAQAGTLVLPTFDANVSDAREMLRQASDAQLLALWTLSDRRDVFLKQPRIGALRQLVLSHIVHHRGQLAVYLRMQDVTVPPLYTFVLDQESEPIVGTLAGGPPIGRRLL